MAARGRRRPPSLRRMREARARTQPVSVRPLPTSPRRVRVTGDRTLGRRLLRLLSIDSD